MALKLRDLIARLRIITDKKSTDETEKSVKSSFSGIEAAARKVGAAIAAAFAFHKIVEFGKAAVKAALESEAAWSNLRGTLENLGITWESVEAKYRAAAAAFMDATIYDDDAFAAGVQRLTVLSGNAAGALENMGFVANVAARYFKGQLEPAIELVGRAMAGQTRVFRAVGLAVDDANVGLEILANRSMGAAEDRAKTFGGQLERLNVQWGEFKEAVGNAIIAAGGGVSILETLTATVKTMTAAIESNGAALAFWGGQSVKFAITSAKGFVFALQEIADTLTFIVLAPLWATTTALALMAKGYALVASAAAHFIPSVREHANEARRLADELKRAAEEQFKYLASKDPRGFWGRNAPRRAPAPPTGPGADTPLPLPDDAVTAAKDKADAIAKAHADAAASVRTSWDAATDAISSGFDRAAESGKGFAAGMAAALLGGLQAYAQGEAAKEIAAGIGKIAAGIWPPNPLALASAGKHFLAATAWSALGGWAGGRAGAAYGGGGGGGSIPSGATDIGGRLAQNTEPKSETHIYVDTLTGKNPRVVTVVGSIMKEAQRTDSSVILHPYPRTGGR